MVLYFKKNISKFEVSFGDALSETTSHPARAPPDKCHVKLFIEVKQRGCNQCHVGSQEVNNGGWESMPELSHLSALTTSRAPNRTWILGNPLSLALLKANQPHLFADDNRVTQMSESCGFCLTIKTMMDPNE
eukprot:TRINITY_DN7933_c0_g1_i3.p1 TRINITY_DN7933_c0_g1~~TRINITY_DN7933_c0_g1_i3.p1  ORF type:complete len:142 (-),score=19.72 TRINITY_DN7933_c0_g1_i3:704-1099(-)